MAYNVSAKRGSKNIIMKQGQTASVYGSNPTMKGSNGVNAPVKEL